MLTGAGQHTQQFGVGTRVATAMKPVFFIIRLAVFPLILLLVSCVWWPITFLAVGFYVVFIPVVFIMSAFDNNTKALTEHVESFPNTFVAPLRSYRGIWTWLLGETSGDDDW